MKIRPMAVELFCADGQTDRHNEANRRFSQFCEKRLRTVSEAATCSSYAMTVVVFFTLLANKLLYPFYLIFEDEGIATIRNV
jgi:hypothetical protein